MQMYRVRLVNEAPPSKEDVYCKECSAYGEKPGKKRRRKDMVFEHECGVPGMYELTWIKNPIERMQPVRQVSYSTVNAVDRNKDNRCGYFTSRADFDAYVAKIIKERMASV